jgi:hypothetical protein
MFHKILFVHVFNSYIAFTLHIFRQSPDGSDSIVGRNFQALPPSPSLRNNNNNAGSIDDTDSLLLSQQASSLSLNDIVEMPPPEPPPDYDQTPRMQTSGGDNIERKTLVSANSNGI